MINHYGKWIDKNKPVTGVYNLNSLKFIMDEIYYGDSINLTYEDWYNEHLETCEDCQSSNQCLEIDYYEENNDTYLIGDWILDTKTNQYEPDTKGEYSAIVSEFVVQVVWSKYTNKGALCSPCYPGQVDADSQGEFLHFALPIEIIGNLDND